MGIYYEIVEFLWISYNLRMEKQSSLKLTTFTWIELNEIVGKKWSNASILSGDIYCSLNNVLQEIFSLSQQNFFSE